jgi:LysR family carnitine catabolism transcriptional activator
MRIHYDIQDIKAFCCLVRVGQYTAAAEQLCITASALSRRITKIEQAIGGRLFDRTTRKVMLTPVGSTFHERVLPLISQLDGCLVEAALLAQGQAGKLKISTVASVGYSVLPRLLPAFYTRHPQVYLSIRDGNATETTRLVESRDVEFGITTPVVFSPALVGEKLISYGFNLVYAVDCALAPRRRKVCWSDLTGLPVAGLNPLSSTRLQIDSILDANDMPLPWTLEVDQLATLIGLVQSGQFLTVPGLFEARGYGLKTVPLHGLDIQRDVFLIQRRDASLTPQAQYLATLVRQHLNPKPATR